MLQTLVTAIAVPVISVVVAIVAADVVVVVVASAVIVITVVDIRADIDAANVDNAAAVAAMWMFGGIAIAVVVAAVVLPVFSANHFIIKFRKPENYAVVHAR